MSLILAIESATTCGSVALINDGVLIGNQFYNLDKSHSSLLHPMIQQMTENVGVSLKNLDAVALSMGPGSYTGLRIGTSTAKGLCYSLDIPLLAINTLRGLAHQVALYNSYADYLCPMIDARRMEVYTMVMDSDLNMVRETEPLILTEESFLDLLDNGKVAFFGDGAAKFKRLTTHPNAVFLDSIFPSAVDIGLLAVDDFAKGNFENTISFEPFYLKEFRTTTPRK